MYGDVHNVPWADDHKEFVAAQWRDGCSATEIAALVKTRFGRVCSRNAVIGIVTRMNLPCERRAPYSPTAPRPRRDPKPGSTPQARPLKAKRSPKAKAAGEPAPAAAPGYVPRFVCHEATVRTAAAVAVRTVDLDSRLCKFPVGEAIGWEQLHCGLPAPQGEVYCPGHRAIAGGGRIDPALVDRKRPPRLARS